MKKILLIAAALVTLGALGTATYAKVGKFCEADCSGSCSEGSSTGSGCGCGGTIKM